MSVPYSARYAHPPSHFGCPVANDSDLPSSSHSGYLPGIGPARVNPNLPATVGKNGSTTGHNHDPYFVDPSNVVAMDCEMVGVGPMGQLSVLARVSIVNWHGCVLLDTFVKVQERVSDYRTFVSGVRPEDLTGPNSMDFGSVRHLVQKMLRGKILVGHGLTNDLKVMHLNHPWHMTRDSATYQPLLRANMQPRRLKELAWTELGMVIQRNGCVHDSVEDARAAMEVYKRYSTRWDYDICCTFPRHRPGVPAYFSF
jgi:RNA exonuclease 4